ncbi:hypothetical protein D9757_011021 [Collybiopsis confluens]|uniref:Core-binding (CB) domain-containing protein n=1 Tax=Collybiopsis confluens TaxID=2823264 RepID=A0A8H5LMN2_9AGAR|nr:hypothetical protein D9757_011021 [Collybiopsis confluens]
MTQFSAYPMTQSSGPGLDSDLLGLFSYFYDKIVIRERVLELATSNEHSGKSSPRLSAVVQRSSTSPSTLNLGIYKFPSLKFYPSNKNIVELSRFTCRISGFDYVVRNVWADSIRLKTASYEGVPRVWRYGIQMEPYGKYQISSETSSAKMDRVSIANRAESLRFCDKGKFVASDNRVSGHIRATLTHLPHLDNNSDSARLLARRAAFSHSPEPILQHFNVDPSPLSPVHNTPPLHSHMSENSSTSAPAPTSAVPDMAQVMAQMAQMISAAQIISQESNPPTVSVGPPPLFASTDTVSLQTPVRAGSTPASGILLEPVPSEWFQAHPHVSTRVAFYLFHASGTRKTYSSGQRQYIDFVRARPALCTSPGQFLPATTLGILEWVASLGDRALQPKTIKAYLSSVRSLHVDAGLAFDAIESPTVQRLICGIKRYYGEKPRHPKLPITAAIMEKLSDTAPNVLLQDDMNFGAAYKLAWSGLLRCGEFTVGEKDIFNPAVHLTRDSVYFVPSIDNPSYVQLTLPECKTDPFRKGVSIIIAAVPGSKFCAVTALKALFTHHPLPSNSPLFARTDGRPMTRSFFISTLRSRLQLAGIDTAGYSGQSFRRGAATSAAAAGYSDYEIQVLGRWRSDAYKLYRDVPVDRTLHLSALLHVAAAAQTQLSEPLALHFTPGAVA